MLMVDQRPYPLRSKGVNIHCPFGYKMFDSTQDLRGAGFGIWAVMLGFPLFSFQQRSTFRAVADIGDRHAPWNSFFYQDFGYFRNDISPLFHVNGIALMQAEPENFVCIVKGGSFHGGSRQQNRGKVGYRRNGPGP